MDEEIKILASETVDKIYRKIRRAITNDFYKFRINTGIGADGTPTKYIDKIAEDVAIKFIRKSDADVNILSEEAGFLNFNGDYTFVLDPIDGTRNAYRGIPFYSVSLGVGRLKLDDIEFGIVRNINTDDIYIAEKGHGAFLNNKRINTPELPEKEIISSLSLGKNIDKTTLSLAKKYIVRSLGSASLEMCMVAIGALDFYVVGKEYLRITDIAASTLIVTEAGGIVKNILGEKIEMSLNLDGRTSIIAACNDELVNDIIS
jgi:myo-inositol-1(or 4)-monophosphatase